MFFFQIYAGRDVTNRGTPKKTQTDTRKKFFMVSGLRFRGAEKKLNGNIDGNKKKANLVEKYVNLIFFCFEWNVFFALVNRARNIHNQ